MVTTLIVLSLASVIWFSLWLMLRKRRPSDEDARKQVGEKILRDLLMLADVDSSVLLPTGYKQRIEGWLTARNNYPSYTTYSGGFDHTGSYRDLAKLLDELAHPGLDEPAEMVFLPSSIQLRTNRWLIQHRWAIEGQRPKALGR